VASTSGELDLILPIIKNLDIMMKAWDLNVEQKANVHAMVGEKFLQQDDME
jgi:hypothetical protein